MTNMQVKILDKKIFDDNRFCYLCSASLNEYIDNLPLNFMDFDIQRGIVSNLYLEKIVDTVLRKEHIPIITLVTAQEPSGDIIKDYKILDGLQRTYRLKILKDSIDLLENLIKHEGEKGENFLSYSLFKLSKMFGDKIRDIGTTPVVIRNLMQELDTKFDNDIDKMKDTFNERQWFEVWVNLTPQQEINKIIVLNAGHKEMTLHHQIELLFINLLPNLFQISKDNDVKILRDKEITLAQYSKSREVGQFYFPHLISAAYSLVEGRLVTLNKKMVNNIEVHELDKVLNYELIEKVYLFLINLDKHLNKEYGEIGVRWISKEVVIIGIFAAMGDFAEAHNINRVKVLEEFNTNLDKSIPLMNLNQFLEQQKSINIGKVNIGNYSKKVVFTGIKYLIENNYTQRIFWNLEGV